MDSPLTDIELDEIEMRCSQATPALWTSYWEGRDHLSAASFIMLHREGQQCDLYLTLDCTLNSEAMRRSDQDFIAHAREDLPRLLEEVRRLRKERNE